ncbi:crossover junction endonuclease EME1 [Arapaima gigas]
MGGIMEEDRSTDSSDVDDLPSYGFLQRRCSQSSRAQAKTADTMATDSLDFEDPSSPPPALSQETCAVGVGGQRDVVMISSESEEEEAYVPLSMRLKQRLGGPATSVLFLNPDQTLRTSEGQPNICALQQQLKINSQPVVHRSAPFIPRPEEGVKDACFTGCPEVFHTLCASGSGLSVEAGSSPPKKEIAKCTMAEIKASKDDGLRRKVGKESRRLELERQRAEKKALVDAVKALRPEECIKHMVVSVDPGRDCWVPTFNVCAALLQVEGGGALLTSLQALGCSCAIEKQSISRSVTWSRRTPGTRASAGEEHGVAESHTVIHVPVDDFIGMVHNYSREQSGVSVDAGQTLTSWTLLLLAQNSGCTPSLAVIDIEKYFRSQKSQNHKKYREAVLGSDPTAALGKRRKKKEGCGKLPEVSRVAMEEACHLQLHTGVQVHFLASWKDFSDYITMSTKAVAEAPFKREREKIGFSFCLESEWAGGQRVDRDGKGLLQVWKRQIQQLNRVSPDMASAVIAAYPSPRLLAEAYGRCTSDREKASLLSDVMIRRGEGVTSTTRRVGPELSKRLFLLMTSLNPEQVLDSGN